MSVTGPVITALVADASQRHCEAIAYKFMQSNSSIKIVAIAFDSLGVHSAVKRFEPDVAVMSAGLRGGPNVGVKAARELWMSGVKTKSIIRTNIKTNSMVIKVFQAGAYGIIGRNEPFEVICKCINGVYQGQVWINGAQLVRLVDYVAENAADSMVTSYSDLLTKSEEKIVHLVAEGLTNRAISHQLGVREQTVKNSLVPIFSKLGISTRLQLALYVKSQKEMRKITTLRAKYSGRNLPFDWRTGFKSFEATILESEPVH